LNKLKNYIREGEELDYEDIEDAAECLINGTTYAGFGGY
jgi:hypothetical protein